MASCVCGWTRTYKAGDVVNPEVKAGREVGRYHPWRCLIWWDVSSRGRDWCSRDKRCQDRLEGLVERSTHLSGEECL